MSPTFTKYVPQLIRELVIWVCVIPVVLPLLLFLLSITLYALALKRKHKRTQACFLKIRCPSYLGLLALIPICSSEADREASKQSHAMRGNIPSSSNSSNSSSATNSWA